MWVCNNCGATGRCFLSRHKAVRGARLHIGKTKEPLDISLVRADDGVEILED